jgi:hypothetical protein
LQDTELARIGQAGMPDILQRPLGALQNRRPHWSCVDGSELARTFLRRSRIGRCGHVFGLLVRLSPSLARIRDAMTQVGCPDRRIDRLCITYCSSFPTFASRRMSARSHYAAKHDGFLIALTFGHHPPRPSWRSCWRVRSRRPWWAAARHQHPAACPLRANKRHRTLGMKSKRRQLRPASIVQIRGCTRAVPKARSVRRFCWG